WHEQRMPIRHVKPRQSRFGDSGNVRREGNACGRSYGKRTDRATLNLRQHRRQGSEHHVNAAGDEVVERWTATTIRYVGHLDPGRALEYLTSQMLYGSSTRRCEGDLAPVGLAVVNEFLDRLRGRGLRHNHRICEDSKPCDGCQIRDRIIADCGKQVGIGREKTRGDEEGVA